MKKINIHIVKKIAITAFWVIAGCATVTLLVSAALTAPRKKCNGIEVTITGVKNNFFIDEKEIKDIIYQYAGKNVKGKMLNEVHLTAIEKVIRKDVWVKNAEIYFDNNQVLHAEVEEREPVARIFTITSNSFYIDSSLMMLPLSEKTTARLPVFTGFPIDAKVLSKADSLLLKNIRSISSAIYADPFLMALIDQIDITPDRIFVMVPKVGNYTIVFGDASEVDIKFTKLKAFYKNIVPKVGLGKYNLLNLQYSNQIVARIKGKEDIIADSLKTKELITMIAAQAKMYADSVKNLQIENDNIDSSMVMQSVQRETISEMADAQPAMLSSSTVATAKKASILPNRKYNNIKNKP